MTVARSGTPSAAACAAASDGRAVARREIDRLQHRVHRTADRGAGAASAPRRLVVDSLVGFVRGAVGRLVARREIVRVGLVFALDVRADGGLGEMLDASRRDRRRTAQARERGLAPLHPGGTLVEPGGVDLGTLDRDPGGFGGQRSGFELGHRWATRCDLAREGVVARSRPEQAHTERSRARVIAT